MKKFMLKVFVICMTIMLCMACVYADDLFDPVTGEKPHLGTLEDKVPQIIGAVQWVGYIIAIIMIACAGIKYVMAGAGEKAKAKETLVPILIGAVLIAGAATIAKAIFGAV